MAAEQARNFGLNSLCQKRPRAVPADRAVKLSDSGGLHLLIQPNGSKLWRLAYRFGGKQKTLAIGVYPTVTLKHARDKRDEAKRLLADSIDPAMQRRLDRLTAARGNTFRAVAEELLVKLEREGRANVTLAKKRWLLDFAYPAIGERPLAEINAPEVSCGTLKANGRDVRAILIELGFAVPFKCGTTRCPPTPRPWC